MKTIYKQKGVSNVLYILYLLVFIVSLCRGVLANEAKAVRTLEAQGWTKVEIVDKAWLIVGLRGCSGKDAARFTAIATNPAGKKAEIYVCSGWPLKGGTIRVN